MSLMGIFGGKIVDVLRDKTIRDMKATEKVKHEQYLEYKRNQAQETQAVFKEKSKEMSQEQVNELKVMLDQLTGTEGKIWEDLQKQKSSCYGRLANKCLIYEDHKKIREYLKEM